jgi:CheY-like chemotaxis protein
MLNILLVEGNSGDASLIKGALRESGQPYQLETMTDSATALQWLSQCEGQLRCPDLILLDWDLPSLNGHEVLKHIKNNAHTRHLPVIILSASRAPEDVRLAYDQHANGYVSKPSSPEELLQTIHRIQSFWRWVLLPSRRLEEV